MVVKASQTSPDGKSVPDISDSGPDPWFLTPLWTPEEGMELYKRELSEGNRLSTIVWGVSPSKPHKEEPPLTP